ncbi:MAG: PD-(D/E)XK nuclease family protein, partial [Planctomycetota bacterium]
DELQRSEQGSLTSLKFADINLILREYLSFIEGRFLDPEVQLKRACEAVAKSPFIKGARLWVDGFAGFTAGELAILKELLKTAEDSTIALCLDPNELGPAEPKADNIDMGELFYPTLRTYADLIEIINQARLELAEPIILQEQMRFSECPELAHIERAASQEQAAPIDAGDNIRIVSAPNERAEVRFVAEEVLRLVKGGDCRYRDIAVIASDIERYQHYVEAYFNDYEVPFFIDRRRPLSRHPAVGLVGSALQIASGDFSNSDIFGYLKTDLVPVGRFDVDLLENYCLAFGITASDWLSKKKWGFAGAGSEEFDEEYINKIRFRVAGPLLELREKLNSTEEDNKIGVEQFTGAVFDLLDVLQVPGAIAGWVRRASEQGDNASADEHRQFYDRLIDVFDELAEVFAGSLLSAEDFAAIIGSAFSQLTLAFIPPKLDQVLVGSIERSRHPNLRAVFLIGATQKHFPVPVGSTGILSEEDRRLAEKAEFDIAGGTERDLVERRYLAYIAFTRASEFLCITYPAVDEKGSGIPRSQFVAELEGRFDGLEEESISPAYSDIENIHNRTDLIETLCTRLGKDACEFEDDERSDFNGLLDAMRSDEALADAAGVIDSVLDYENRSCLDDGIVSQFSGKKLRGSATRLGAFAACPYQHFARYMLGLEERKEFKFEPLDLGNFYHAVLDALVKEVRARALSFGGIDDERLKKMLHEQIERMAEGDSFLANFTRHGPHNAFILQNAGEILEDCVLAVGRMVRAGSFEPALSEASFGLPGDHGDTLGKYELALAGGRKLSLSGKIDRLDTANVEGEDLAIVFDYKRRAKSFNWTGFHHGLDMQLP